jgi:hypothetical protein
MTKAEMPENETLLTDSRIASRWRPIAEHMDEGQSPTDAFPVIQDQFYTQLQRVWRQWQARGVDPAKLFDVALNDHKAFQELLKQTGSDQYARLLQDVAAVLQDADLNTLVRSFVDAAWDSVRDQLQLDRREDSLPHEFICQIQSMLGCICRRLLGNLSRFPSRSRKEPPPDLDTRLGESLL